MPGLGRVFVRDDAPSLVVLGFRDYGQGLPMNVTFSLGRLTAFVNAIDEQIARRDCDETIDPLDMIQALQKARAALDAPRTEAETEPHVQGNHLVGVYVCPTERALALFKAIDRADLEIDGARGILELRQEYWTAVIDARKAMGR